MSDQEPTPTDVPRIGAVSPEEWREVFHEARRSVRRLNLPPTGYSAVLMVYHRGYMVAQGDLLTTEPITVVKRTEVVV